ncbi:hypothetical protein [Candidatus Vondammii sp. HM_W22]|uniref:hypothetical protein n=1 Tax=Candidatus Vondammii sp. HM_W22 TaxID=2687299 RepID=UPI001F129B74|nr:hypothetical protein [Candidatus Vondammii sp. HM_W22]
MGVVIYAYNAPKQKPEQTTTLTPKEYIELVEVKKKERLKKSAEEAAKTQTQEKTR